MKKATAGGRISFSFLLQYKDILAMHSYGMKILFIMRELAGQIYDDRDTAGIRETYYG